MAEEGKLQADIGVEDQTAEGMESAVQNISKGIDQINETISRGMGGAERTVKGSMNNMGTLMARFVIRSTVRLVNSMEQVRNVAETTFARFSDSAELTESSLSKLGSSGAGSLGEMSKALQLANQEVGSMFSEKDGARAQSILSNLAVQAKNLEKSTGVAMSTQMGAFRALTIGLGDTEKAWNLVTASAVSGNGKILNSIIKIGQEAPSSLGKVSEQWLAQLGGAERVAQVTDAVQQKQQTFSSQLLGTLNSLKQALDPLIQSMASVASIIFPPIQAGLKVIQSVLKDLPAWVKELGAFLMIVTMVGFAVNFASMALGKFGGLIGMLIGGFKVFGNIAIFPFILINQAVKFTGKAFAWLSGIAVKVGKIMSIAFSFTGLKILAIGSVAAIAGFALYNSFLPFRNLIDSIIAKIKSLYGLLGKKFSSAMGSVKSGGKMPSMKPVGMPKMPSPKPIKAKAPKAPKVKKPKVDKSAEKARKAQEKEAKRLAKIEKDITKRMNDEINRRKDAYMNFVGFWEGVNRRTVGISNLLKNFRSQEQALKDYSEAIKTLQDRLGSGETATAFIAELQKLGPASVDEIQALATSSDGELQEVVDIFSRRSALAKDMATDEVAKLEPIFRKEIEDANKASDDTLGDGGKQWNNTLDNTMGDMGNTMDMGLGDIDNISAGGWGDIGDTFDDSLRRLDDNTDRKTNSIVTKIKESWGRFASWWRNYWAEHGVIGGIVRGAGWLVGGFSGLFARVTHAVMEKMDKLTDDLWNYVNGHTFIEIGQNIVQGLVKGIQSLGHWMHGKVMNFCSGVIDGFKKGMDTHSPSKATYEIGMYTSEGMALGIDDGYDKYLTGIADDFVGGLGFDWDVNQEGSNIVGGNIVIQNMSVRNDQDIELIAQEIDRLKRRQMQGRGAYAW